MKTPPEELNKAFNLGSDARIHGIPQSGNPYNSRKELGDTFCWEMWRMGWKHIHTNWGVDNKYYTILELPGVRHLPWK